MDNNGDKWAVAFFAKPFIVSVAAENPFDYVIVQTMVMEMVMVMAFLRASPPVVPKNA